MFSQGPKDPSGYIWYMKKIEGFSISLTEFNKSRPAIEELVLVTYTEV